MEKKATKAQRKPLLYLSLAVNLGLLVAFKYLGFFSSIVSDTLEFAGSNASFSTFDILLPVGISFYTFQTLSYSIDVYRGQRKAERHFGYFALFVSFFPQLVAGPIERSSVLLPQLKAKQRHRWHTTTQGFQLIVWGLFKKVLIADYLGIFVNEVFGQPELFGGSMYLLAGMAFMVQIYADFSGYTDIAIGSAKLLGIELSTNFKRPFFSTSVAEVWRRWHITLYKWLRDYVYIPLGGSKRGKWRWRVNVFLVFVLIGLWHGAAWGFVLFGAVHAVYIVLGEATQKWRTKLATSMGLSKESKLRKAINTLLTFFLWSYAVIAFRAESLDDAWTFYSGMWSDLGLLRYQYVLQEFTLVHFCVLSSTLLFGFLLEWHMNNVRRPLHTLGKPVVRMIAMALMLMALLVFEPRSQEAFLYFQF